MQIQRHVHPQTDQVGHVVHLAAPARDTVLDLLLIFLKIRQQLILVSVQESTDILFDSFQGKLRTYGKVLVGH